MHVGLIEKRMFVLMELNVYQMALVINVNVKIKAIQESIVKIVFIIFYFFLPNLIFESFNFIKTMLVGMIRVKDVFS